MDASGQHRNPGHSNHWGDSVVEIVDQLIADAIKRRASDIHLEPFEAFTQIRFRIDGVLHPQPSVPAGMQRRIAARVKVMAGLDVAERRLPQDGRIRVSTRRGTEANLRANTLPTLWGEKIVLRILESPRCIPSIDQLGMDSKQLDVYRGALRRSQGLILVTGPTGSGKTLTLYSGLTTIDRARRNVSAAEDPVEIDLAGVNQVSTASSIGLDFPMVLRAFLRQDPDVIMVGEIRDKETAQMAIRASSTGHLVLSTLHTNSAAASLSRLRNMGIPTFNLAHSIQLIIAQRLVRKLCPHCKKPSEATLFEAQGCELCTEGYTGRVGVYEMLPVDERLSRLIIDEADTLDIEKFGRDAGHLGLRQACLEKVRCGLTSIEEANRLA